MLPATSGIMLCSIRPLPFFLPSLAVRRKCSRASSGGSVRVRFAPSPTGFMHLGGLRTALYNYLFARSTGGQFILRIEDTDQTRLVAGAVENLIACLRWAGLEPDEGPAHGGFYGPYVQSERLDLYRQAVDMLLEHGSAYRCFCSERRLDLLRKDAARRQERPRYDNACRSLDQADVAAKLRDQLPHTVRLKLEAHPQPWQDLVHGPIVHDVAEVEGDPVLLKSDGYPTYHLANVVDDHHMQISHVLRGLEWQSSTTKHLLLFKAFGWMPPQYGHLPLMLSQDGSKLSKRQGDIRIDSLKVAGYLPGSIVDLLTMSGGGFTVSQQDLPGMSLAQLAASFSVSKLRTGSARVELERLDDFNRARLRRLPTELGQAAFCSQLREVFLSMRRAAACQEGGADSHGHAANKNNSNQYGLSDMTDHEIDRAVNHIWSHFDKYVERITTLNDLAGPEFAYQWLAPRDPNLTEFLYKEGQNWTTESLRQTITTLAHTSDADLADETKSAAVLKSLSRLCCPRSGTATTARYFGLLRTCLSGRQEGPPVTEMLLHIGRSESLERLQAAMRTLTKLGMSGQLN